MCSELLRVSHVCTRLSQNKCQCKWSSGGDQDITVSNARLKPCSYITKERCEQKMGRLHPPYHLCSCNFVLTFTGFWWPKYRISPSISPWSPLRRQFNSKMKVNRCQQCLIASVHRYLSSFGHMVWIRVKGTVANVTVFRGWEGGKGGGASPILLEAKDITLIKVWGHGHITRKILWAHAALMQIENVGARQ